MRLQMTEFEICQEYRLAKNPKDMIGILADRNVVERQDIIEILIRNGEMHLGKQKRKKSYPEGLEEMVGRVERKELTAAQAADKIGVTEYQFKYHMGRFIHERTENNLVEKAAQNVAAG